MDPEELAQLLTNANRLIQSGDKTEEQINEAFTQGFGLSFSEAAEVVRRSNIQQQEETIAANAEAQAQPEIQTGDILATAGNSALFNFLDEIVGGARAAGALMPGGQSPSEAFQEGRESILSREDRLREASPLAALTAEISGGFVPGAGALKIANMARRGRGAKALVTGILGGGAAGGGIGGLSALGAGEDPGTAALVGGIGGGALAGAGQVGPNVAGGLLRLAAGRFSPNAIAREAASMISRAAPKTAATARSASTRSLELTDDVTPAARRFARQALGLESAPVAPPGPRGTPLQFDLSSLLVGAEGSVLPGLLGETIR